MPLPELAGPGTRFVAEFDNVEVAETKVLERERRIAVLELTGLNLLMQRFVFHLTRVAVPTFEFAKATLPLFEETDLMEEWVDVAISNGVPQDDAERACHSWLRGEVDGRIRQELLRESPDPSTVASGCHRCCPRGVGYSR
jgi:hypothetical protein